MAPEFMPDEWKTLSPAGRVRLCRDLAAEARGMAADADPDIREIHLRIAAEWLKLAKEIENPSTEYSSDRLNARREAR